MWTKAGEAQRSLSIQARIALLVVACILPVALLAALVIYLYYDRERANIGEHTLEITRGLMRVVERDLAANEAALRALGTSSRIDLGDFASFHRQAKEVLGYTSGFTIVLTDASGQQVVNLLRPFGSPLPRHGNPELLRRVLESGKAIVSDVYIGGVTQKPLVGFEVPVIRNGKALYGLALGIDPTHLGEIMRRQELPREWVVAILDSTGTILARSHAGEQWVGRKGSAPLLARMREAPEGVISAPTLEGIPVLAAFSRSPAYGWTVAIGVPEAIVTAELRRSLGLYAAGAILMLLAGLGMASYLGRRIAAPIQALIAPSVAIGKGEPVSIPPLALKEADEVAHALLQAQRLIQERAQQRRQAEDALRESEQRLRLFVEHTPAAVAMFDRQMRYLAASRRFVTDYRISLADVIGRSHYEVFPEISERWKEIHRRCLAGAIEKCEEDPFPRADGTLDWVRWEIHPWRDAAGEVGGIVLFSENITERKRAQEALRTNEERFSAIIRTAMDAVITLDQDQRIVLFNTAAEKIFRCPASEVIGRTVDRFVPERYRETHHTHIERFGTDGVTARSMSSPERLLGQRADGELFPFEATISQVSTGGQKLYTVILRDISEREKAQQALRAAEAERDKAEQAERQMLLAKEVAERANEAKAAFLANVSHELRTPLNAILGFSRLMRNATDVTAEQVHNLDIINRSGEHLLNLINNVLDITRIESGHMELKEVEVDLKQLLHGIQSLMHARAAEKGLAFVSQCAPDLPRHVVADADKLRQVLINLSGNAIKFTRRGSVLLRAAVAKLGSPPEARVRFELEDSGPGIGEEDRKRIFIPFVQLGEQPSTEAGTGLGLFLCKQYVELMRGEIGVESELGRGSVFHFEIPVRISERTDVPDTDARRRRIAGLAPGQPSHRLLIAEDQAENRLLLRKLLEPLGFELREATDGEQTLAAFHDWHPDLIWMDIRMPKIDGMQVIRQIRSRPPGARTKIVAVTAHVFDDERNRILAAGCDDVIRKPYQESEIFDALTKHLGVRFQYSDGQPLPAGAGELSLADLATRAPELLDALRDAAELLDMQSCLAIAASIGRSDPELGARLRRMIESMQFQQLLGLLDSLPADRSG